MASNVVLNSNSLYTIKQLLCEVILNGYCYLFAVISSSFAIGFDYVHDQVSLRGQNYQEQ